MCRICSLLDTVTLNKYYFGRQSSEEFDFEAVIFAEINKLYGMSNNLNIHLGNYFEKWAVTMNTNCVPSEDESSIYLHLPFLVCITKFGSPKVMLN